MVHSGNHTFREPQRLSITHKRKSSKKPAAAVTSKPIGISTIPVPPVGSSGSSVEPSQRQNSKGNLLGSGVGQKVPNSSSVKSLRSLRSLKSLKSSNLAAVLQAGA